MHPQLLDSPVSLWPLAGHHPIEDNTLRIKVKFFAQVRQLVGTETLEVEVPADTTVASLCDQLAQQKPALHSRLASLLIALNGEFARLGVSLKEGDEVALLPPFSGG